MIKAILTKAKRRAPLLILCLLLTHSCDFRYRITGSSIAEYGIVKAYDYSHGKRGKLIAEGDLYNREFQIAIGENYSVILIELERFSIFDPISQVWVYSPESITWKSLVSYPNQGTNYNINPITTLGYALSKYKIETLKIKSFQESSKTTKECNSIVGRHFGVSKITITSPDNLEMPSDLLSDEIKYELILYSLMEISNYYRSDQIFSGNMTVGNLNIVDLSAILEEDIISDGYVDCLGKDSAILCSNGFTEKLLKADLALSLFRLLNNLTVNKTGISSDDAKEYLNSISLSQSEIFKTNSPVYVFDHKAPSITCYSPVEGEVYTEKIIVNCHAFDDIPGVDNLSAKINDKQLENLIENPSSFYGVIDTPNDVNSALISIHSSDFMGNRTYKYINVIIDK